MKLERAASSQCPSGLVASWSQEEWFATSRSQQPTRCCSGRFGRRRADTACPCAHVANRSDMWIPTEASSGRGTRRKASSSGAPQCLFPGLLYGPWSKAWHAPRLTALARSDGREPVACSLNMKHGQCMSTPVGSNCSLRQQSDAARNNAHMPARADHARRPLHLYYHRFAIMRPFAFGLTRLHMCAAFSCTVGDKCSRRSARQLCTCPSGSRKSIALMATGGQCYTCMSGANPRLYLHTDNALTCF